MEKDSLYNIQIVNHLTNMNYMEINLPSLRDYNASQLNICMCISLLSCDTVTHNICSMQLLL